MATSTKTLTEVKWDCAKKARYLNTNSVDPDTDIKGDLEFDDVNEDLKGLTVVAPEGVLETIRYLNGYHLD